mgnify:CR=1 FL=1
MGLVQIRVDDKIKNEASKVFEELGLDLSTAVRMFLIKSIEVNGIPFSTIKENKEERERVNLLMKKFEERSKELGNDAMTLDDINQIINDVRKERNN